MVLDFEVFTDIERMLAEAPFLFVGIKEDNSQDILAIADNEGDITKFTQDVWPTKPEEIREKYKEGTQLIYQGSKHTFPFKTHELCNRVSDIMTAWCSIDQMLNKAEEVKKE